MGQFDASTAAEFGLTDRTNPYASIDAAAQYDAQLYGAYGNWTDALTHYGTIGPNVPQSVNDAAAQIINDPQSAAGMSWFSNTLDGLKNLFGGAASDIFSGDYFGGLVPELNGGAFSPTPAGQSAPLLGPASGIATRGVVIVLALIFVAGGIYLFGTGKQIAILKK